MWQTRTLWLAGLTAMSLGPLGCVVEDTDDSALVASWRVAYVAGGGPVSCEDSGTPTVRLTAKNLRTGAVFPGDFPCQAGSGVTDVLPLGEYEVNLALLDAKGRTVSQLSGGPWPVRRHGLTSLDPIEFQVQVFELDWILVKNTGGVMSQATCPQVGAATVELEVGLASEPREKFRFDCNDGEGITQAIRVGNYAAQVRLLDATGKSLSETTVMSVRVVENERPAISIIFDLL